MRGCRFILLVMVVVLGASTGGCKTNPITGKKEFMPFMPSKSEQVALGLKSAPYLAKEGGGKINNTAMQEYINTVGQKVAALAPAKLASGYKFTYTALAAKDVNACALPGGPIFVYQGLLSRMDNEAQLAFVLGHETGHVLAQHSARQINNQTELNVLLGAADVAAGMSGAGAMGQSAEEMAAYAGQMYLMKYSRDEESQADSLGLDLMVKAGYDPKEAIAVMQILDKASGGSGGGNDWFESHPAPKTRIQDLTKWTKNRYPGKVNATGLVIGQEEYHAKVLGQKAGAGWERGGVPVSGVEVFDAMVRERVGALEM